MARNFSTSEMHPRDRVAYWREVVLGEFAGHAFRAGVGQTFLGSLEVNSLAGLHVAFLESDPYEAARSHQDVARCSRDELVLYLQVAGQTIISQDGRQAVLESGGLGILDMQRTCAADHRTGGKCIFVGIPRRQLEARLGCVAALTAQGLDARNPVVGLASGFLGMLPGRIDALDDQSAAKIAEQALDLVALAFSVETQKNVVALSSPRALALLRLRSAVESRLSDPDFKPADAAAAAGISVRYANALLSAEDTSLERYILQRRLERCRLDLDDPVQARRAIGDIAYGWGFSDLSHFSRRFKSTFGSLPSEYRRRRA